MVAPIKTLSGSYFAPSGEPNRFNLPKDPGSFQPIPMPQNPRFQNSRGAPYILSRNIGVTAAISRQRQAEQFIQDGDRFSTSNQLDKAVAAYQKAVQVQPQLINGYIGLSRAYKGLGKLDSAISALEKVLFINPRHQQAKGSLAENHKELGNRYRELQLNEKALYQYAMSLQYNPLYTDAHYDMAKTYMVLGDKSKAIGSFQKLLGIDPLDHEARVIMAQLLIDIGLSEIAKQHYKIILRFNPLFDPASRNLKMLENKQLGAASPLQAKKQFKQYSQWNLQEARKLVAQYFKNDFDMQMVLNTTNIEFAPTQVVQEVENLAEYDNDFTMIRLKPEMAFSHPNVLAAYWIHELIHAKDRDGLTSIREEQDAYLELAKFWKVYKNKISEPNLDLALECFNKSPNALMGKVRQLYLIRTPNIPEVSPGHGA